MDNSAQDTDSRDSNKAARPAEGRAAPAPATTAATAPNRVLRWSVGALIMAVGVAAAIGLVLTRNKQTTEPPVYLGPSVEVMRPVQQDVTVTVQGQGTVRPRAVVQLVPQVSGRVLAVHPAMAVGGFFQAGETLIEIDPSDFELAINQARAQQLEAKAAVSTAKAAIAEADARLADAHIEADHFARLFDRDVANRREKERADLQVDIARAQVDSAIALLESADAALATAAVRVEQARLDLDRVHLSLPFTGRLLSKSVDVGQFIRSGESVATAYDVSRAEVLIPLSTDELRWFDVPLENASSPTATGGVGAPNEVRLTASFAGQMQTWRGRVSRMEGEIDPRSRMARLVITIDNPFDTDGGPPLMPGLFVNAEIPGNTLDDVFVVPRHAVHNGNEVWVVQGGCLNLRTVKVERTDLHSAYISEGLSPNMPVIVSQLEVVTDGMKVRAVEVENDRAGGGTNAATDQPGDAS